MCLCVLLLQLKPDKVHLLLQDKFCYPTKVIKLLLCGWGNALLHHPKLLVFFHWLNLLRSVNIHLSEIGSHDLLNYI